MRRTIPFFGELHLCHSCPESPPGGPYLDHNTTEPHKLQRIQGGLRPRAAQHPPLALRPRRARARASEAKCGGLAERGPAGLWPSGFFRRAVIRLGPGWGEVCTQVGGFFAANAVILVAQRLASTHFLNP